MIIRIVLAFLILVYTAITLQAVICSPTAELKKKYWDIQPTIGKVLMTVFFFPTWVAKFVRIALDFAIKR